MATPRPNPKQPKWFLISLPLISVFCLGLAFIPFASAGTDPSTIAAVCFLLGAAPMSGIVLGTSNRAIRFAIAPFFVLLNSFIVGRLTGYSSFDWVGALIPALTFLVVFATIEISKLLAGKFVVPGVGALVEEAFQFRISHLLIATAVVAVLMSLGQWLYKYIEGSSGINDSDLYVIVGTFVGVFTVITLTNVWALLGMASVGVRAFVAVIISALAIASPLLLGGQDLIWTAMFVTAWIAVLVQLCAMRSMGIRFVRRGTL